MIPDALLEQSHFVRSLAHSLVLDENRAEDIVQKAWVIALRRPPQYLKSPRGWLSTVVRNLVRMEKRDAVRRMKRENPDANLLEVLEGGLVRNAVLGVYRSPVVGDSIYTVRRTMDRQSNLFY